MLEDKRDAVILSVVLVIGFMLIFGSLQYAYLNKKFNKDFSNKLNMFQAGYNDGTIRDISQLIIECSPENVEAFNLIDLEERHRGIMFKCIGNNNTKTMEFTGLYGKYKEIN